ncbi:hypothetical protein B7988_11760 [Fibrobacter sp. UWB1]|nr:hypothetical protein B7988_11760 [Fibrobacter sp. UWB1]
MRGLALLIVCLASLACAMDFPGEFVQNPGGSLALSGLPGYKSSPARIAAPGFGLAYAQVGEASLQVAGAAGELGLLRDYRLAFFSSYLEMDSLYRQVYSEWNLSVAKSWIVGGVGYGLSVDWIPGDRFSRENWTMNRYKAGLAFLKNPLSFSMMTALVNHRSFYDLDYAVAIRFQGERFGAFIEYDGTSIDIGHSLNFAHAFVLSAYRFPEFAVSVSMGFTFGTWQFSGAYGNARSIWDWFGFTAAKSVRKKTIL